jgi:MFS family permease
LNLLAAARRGPLREREFRLLFVGTTVTTFGDRLGSLALVFAILDLPGGNATKLGIVLGVRQAVESAVVIAGGVLADRFPRSMVLVGASMLQGVAQAATAAVALTGTASIWPFVTLQLVYGVGGGIVVPAEVGLIPQTVTPARLQQANALQGLARNAIRVIGPALAGVIIVAASPGVALALDAASFVLCAALLAMIKIPPRAREAGASFVAEIREGWSGFVSRPWLWVSVVLIGLANAVHIGCWSVLGPVIAKARLGGAGAWAAISASGGVGSLMGAAVAFRYKPERPLYASVVLACPLTLQLVALALHAPVWLLALVALVAAAGLSVSIALWFTVFQQQVPEHLQSRVSSYDALGSLVLVPLSMAAVGPIAAAVGQRFVLAGGVAIFLLLMGTTAAVPSVRAIRREPSPQAATT